VSDTLPFIALDRAPSGISRDRRCCQFRRGCPNKSPGSVVVSDPARGCGADAAEPHVRGAAVDGSLPPRPHDVAGAVLVTAEERASSLHRLGMPGFGSSTWKRVWLPATPRAERGATVLAPAFVTENRSVSPERRRSLTVRSHWRRSGAGSRVPAAQRWVKARHGLGDRRRIQAAAQRAIGPEPAQVKGAPRDGNQRLSLRRRGIEPREAPLGRHGRLERQEVLGDVHTRLCERRSLLAAIVGDRPGHVPERSGDRDRRQRHRPGRRDLCHLRVQVLSGRSSTWVCDIRQLR
jgi:hypothetical protein